MVSFKDAVRPILTDDELDFFKGSYDVVGDIAILEIDPELRHKEKEIASVLLHLHKRIHTVVRKEGSHTGVCRLQQYIVLAGEEGLVTEHKENGCLFRLDISQVYFSPRTGSERLRVVTLAGPEEKVLVLFAGCGPFVIPLAKKGCAVVAVEINEKGCDYLRENIRLNKVSASVYCDDVRTVSLSSMFDRIIMPLPSDSHMFLDVITKWCHAGTVVHFYTFVGMCQTFKENADVEAFLREKLGNITILAVVPCGDIAVHAFRMCFDVKVL